MSSRSPISILFCVAPRGYHTNSDFVVLLTNTKDSHEIVMKEITFHAVVSLSQFGPPRYFFGGCMKTNALCSHSYLSILIIFLFLFYLPQSVIYKCQNASIIFLALVSSSSAHGCPFVSRL